MDKGPEISVDEITEEVFSLLKKRGPQNAAQIAYRCGYPLQDAEFTERFLGVLDRLNQQGLVEWYNEARTPKERDWISTRIYHIVRPQ